MPTIVSFLIGGPCIELLHFDCHQLRVSTCRRLSDWESSSGHEIELAMYSIGLHGFVFWHIGNEDGMRANGRHMEQEICGRAILSVLYLRRCVEGRLPAVNALTVPQQSLLELTRNRRVLACRRPHHRLESRAKRRPPSFPPRARTSPTSPTHPTHGVSRYQISEADVILLIIRALEGRNQVRAFDLR
jgi:hypothetical protein